MTNHQEWEDTGSQLAGLGAIATLETRLESMYGLPYALAVSSATSGLLALGLAAELAGAEFVTTAYTWGGTVAPFMMLGARPVFADIDPGTLTLDPCSVERAITPRTRAILSVDMNGNPADDAKLREIATRYNVPLIADAAQSFGATREGRPASALADAFVISFSTGKSLAAGEGGAILTSRADIYERLLLLTQHPSRVARELGMARRTEYVPLNARMHPAAATRLVAEWDAELASLSARQVACFEILEGLLAAGLVHDDRFKNRQVLPYPAPFGCGHASRCRAFGHALCRRGPASNITKEQNMPYCRKGQHAIVRCARCGGKGTISKSSAFQGRWEERCPACNGAGQVAPCNC